MTQDSCAINTWIILIFFSLILFFISIFKIIQNECPNNMIYCGTSDISSNIYICLNPNFSTTNCLGNDIKTCFEKEYCGISSNYIYVHQYTTGIIILIVSSAISASMLFPCISMQIIINIYEKFGRLPLPHT